MASQASLYAVYRIGSFGCWNIEKGTESRDLLKAFEWLDRISNPYDTLGTIRVQSVLTQQVMERPA